MTICRKSICSKCPFTKESAPGWLGPFDSFEDIHQSIMAEVPFVCHLHLDRDLDVDEAGTEEYPLCRGALTYMRKHGKLPLYKPIEMAMGQITENDINQVFWYNEALKHHNHEDS